MFNFLAKDLMLPHFTLRVTDKQTLIINKIATCLRQNILASFANEIKHLSDSPLVQQSLWYSVQLRMWEDQRAYPLYWDQGYIKETLYLSTEFTTLAQDICCLSNERVMDLNKLSLIKLKQLQLAELTNFELVGLTLLQGLTACNMIGDEASILLLMNKSYRLSDRDYDLLSKSLQEYKGKLAA